MSTITHDNGDLTLALTPAEQEQLAKDAQLMDRERRTGLGGTDIAAILGQHRWKSAVDVWLEKTGRSEPIDMNKRMLWGLRMEAMLAKIYAAKHGVQVRRPARTEDNPTGMKRHPDFPWLIAHVDRLVLNTNKGLECKTAGQFRANEWGDELSDDVPVEYLFQCMAYNTVYGFDVVDLEVLIGGNDDRTYRVPRNDRLIGVIIEEAEKFWKSYVEKDKQPPLEPSRRSVEILNTLYPVDSGAVIEATPEIEEAVKEYEEIYGALKRQEKYLDKCKSTIMEFMGDAQVLAGSGWKCTWKTVQSARLDSKRLKAEMPEIAERFTYESSYRRFTGPTYNKVKK